MATETDLVVEIEEPSFTAGRTINWCNYSGNGESSKKIK